MTKVQKIWLGIFLAMFIIPEILWGSLFGLPSIVNSSYRLSGDNHFGLVIITLVQFLGLSSSAALVLRKGSGKYKNSVGIILAGASAWALIVFYALYATLHMWS